MANGDYWDYLRSSNELKHSGVKGMRWGQSSNPNYTPIGQKAKGIIDAAGNYVYNAIKGVRDFRNNLAGNLGRLAAKRKILGSYIKDTIGNIRSRLRADQAKNVTSSAKNAYDVARYKALYGPDIVAPKGGSGSGGKRAYDDETGEWTQQAMNARARQEAEAEARGTENYKNYSVGYQSFMERKRAEEAEEERKRRMAKMAQYMQY